MSEEPNPGPTTKAQEEFLTNVFSVALELVTTQYAVRNEFKKLRDRQAKTMLRKLTFPSQYLKTVSQLGYHMSEQIDVTRTF